MKQYIVLLIQAGAVTSPDQSQVALERWPREQRLKGQ